MLGVTVSRGRHSMFVSPVRPGYGHSVVQRAHGWEVSGSAPSSRGSFCELAVWVWCPTRAEARRVAASLRAGGVA